MCFNIYSIIYQLSTNTFHSNPYKVFVLVTRQLTKVAVSQAQKCGAMPAFWLLMLTDSPLYHSDKTESIFPTNCFDLILHVFFINECGDHFLYCQLLEESHNSQSKDLAEEVAFTIFFNTNYLFLQHSMSFNQEQQSNTTLNLNK